MNSAAPLRPREKIQQRSQSALSDHELLQALLGSGTKQKNVRLIARELLKLIKRGEAALSFEAVQSVEGVGPAKAAVVVAAFELSRRYLRPTEYSGFAHQPNGKGMYCRYYSGGGRIIDDRWFPEELVSEPRKLIQQVMATALRLGCANYSVYDGVHIDDTLGRLEALHRRYLFMGASNLIGVRLLKYVLVHQNLAREEVT